MPELIVQSMLNMYLIDFTKSTLFICKKFNYMYSESTYNCNEFYLKPYTQNNN